MYVCYVLRGHCLFFFFPRCICYVICKKHVCLVLFTCMQFGNKLYWQEAIVVAWREMARVGKVVVVFVVGFVRVIPGNNPTWNLLVVSSYFMHKPIIPNELLGKRHQEKEDESNTIYFSTQFSSHRSYNTTTIPFPFHGGILPWIFVNFLLDESSITPQKIKPSHSHIHIYTQYYISMPLCQCDQKKRKSLSPILLLNPFFAKKIYIKICLTSLDFYQYNFFLLLFRMMWSWSPCRLLRRRYTSEITYDIIYIYMYIIYNKNINHHRHLRRF